MTPIAPLQASTAHMPYTVAAISLAPHCLHALNPFDGVNSLQVSSHIFTLLRPCRGGLGSNPLALRFLARGSPKWQAYTPKAWMGVFPLVHEEVLLILFSIASTFVVTRQALWRQNHSSIELFAAFCFLGEVFTSVGIKADGRRWGQRQAFVGPDCERE